MTGDGTSPNKWIMMVLIAIANGRLSGGTVHIVAMLTAEVVMKIKMQPIPSRPKKAYGPVTNTAARQSAVPTATSADICHNAFKVRLFWFSFLAIASTISVGGHEN